MRQLPRIALVVVLGAVVAAPGLFAPRDAQSQSLGQELKRIFKPTPTPAPKKRKSSTSTKKRTSPTPTPSATPKAGASETPTASPTPSPTSSPSATPKRAASPSPSPSASPRKKKGKGSPSPSPSPSPTPSPEESPSPFASASPSPSPTPAASPSATASPDASASPRKERSGGVSIAPDEITGFQDYPPEVKKVVELSLDLASRNLTYKYGSADPGSGGLDCSGFVYYVLRESGLTDVPRDSSGQYNWVRKAGNFVPVISHKDDSYEMEQLKPGDLLFWTGTYDIERDPPITHAMIYLGREKSTGKRIMVGASDGRVYRDQSRFGVSVFDLKVSRPGRAAANGRTPDFVGYGRVPGLGGEKP